MMVSELSPVKDQAATIIYRYYEEAFKTFDKGYASAIAAVALVMILIITVLQFVMQKKWVNYD
jgi:multiple sugar transport system permease protein